MSKSECMLSLSLSLLFAHSLFFHESFFSLIYSLSLFSYLLVSYLIFIYAIGDTAAEEDFLFTLPVEVNWSALRSDSLQRCFERNQTEFDVKPFNEHCFVFHRGVGAAEITNYFFSQKLDLLVEYIIEGLKNLISTNKNKHSIEQPEDNLDQSRITNSTNLKLPSDNAQSKQNYAKRLTLHRALPSVWAILKNLPNKISLKEPTFKDVIVLCCLTRKFKQKLQYSDHFCLKSFRDVPMADVEMVAMFMFIYILYDFVLFFDNDVMFIYYLIGSK